MSDFIIVFNAGSSSLKFSLFEANNLALSFHGQVDDIPDSPKLIIKDENNNEILCQEGFKAGHSSAISTLFNWIESHSDGMEIIAAGHRVVHGGRNLSTPEIIDEFILDELKALIPLAPLHQPHNIAVIEAFTELHPDIKQIACFDTAFHHTLSKEAEQFALPRKLTEEGIIRYGFHGLSYQYIASQLPEYMDDKANGRVIVAHLGNGASMCAIKDFRSIATTMGFTALDGLIMGTRCGNIAPGVILYLLEEKGMSSKEITNLLYKESGLKGISGISHDMRDLLQSDAPEAKQAIELFCYQAAKQLAGLITDLGGLDAIVFTAGVGEGSCVIRKNICDRLKWLNIELDETANDANQSKVSSSNSKVAVFVIPTNEEKVIAEQTLSYSKMEKKR